jgi:hypothetical protein
MLASQMTVTHSLAMEFLGRAKRAEYIPQLEASANFAVKLSAYVHGTGGSIGQASARRRTDSACRTRPCPFWRSSHRGKRHPCGRGNVKIRGSTLCS